MAMALHLGWTAIFLLADNISESGLGASRFTGPLPSLAGFCFFISVRAFLQSCPLRDLLRTLGHPEGSKLTKCSRAGHRRGSTRCRISSLHVLGDRFHQIEILRLLIGDNCRFAGEDTETFCNCLNQLCTFVVIVFHHLIENGRNLSWFHVL